MNANKNIQNKNKKKTRNILSRVVATSHEQKRRQTGENLIYKGKGKSENNSTR